MVIVLQEIRIRARIGRHARQNSTEFGERRPDLDTTAIETVFADSVFMSAGALLGDGDGTAYLSARFKEAKQKHGIAEISKVDRRLHRADQTVLRENQHGDDALLI